MVGGFPQDLYLTPVTLVFKGGAPCYKFGRVHQTLRGPLVVAEWKPKDNMRLDKEKRRRGDEYHPHNYFCQIVTL